MRKVLLAMIVALGASLATAPGARASCPYCDLWHGTCLGGEFSTLCTMCEQRPNSCYCHGGECNITLDAPAITPDGSARAELAADFEGRVLEVEGGNATAQYTVVSCRNYVVRREYDPDDAARRRDSTASIPI